MNRQAYDREISAFAHYYLGDDVKEAIKQRYAKYMHTYPGSTNEKDIATLDFAVNHPWSIKLLDAGLAIISPQAELRRRLYVMFALIEADREYAHLFLAQKKSKLYLLNLFFVGIGAVIKMVAGIVLAKAVAR